MNGAPEELLAALAAGAADETEAAQLTGRLAAEEELREAFAGHRNAVEYLALSAIDDDAKPGAEQKRRMLARIVTEAASEKKALPPLYERLVPADCLLRFGPGIEWAVLSGKNMTTVFWIFTPPECGNLPLETHVHEQSGFVLEGSFTLLDAGGDHRFLKTGNHYAIASGAGHGAEFHERTILCDVYVPKHDEFERTYAQQRAASLEVS